jgi:hypothetical protein
MFGRRGIVPGGEGRGGKGKEGKERKEGMESYTIRVLKSPVFLHEQGRDASKTGNFG